MGGRRDGRTIPLCGASRAARADALGHLRFSWGVAARVQTRLLGGGSAVAASRRLGARGGGEGRGATSAGGSFRQGLQGQLATGGLTPSSDALLWAEGWLACRQACNARPNH